MKTHRPIAVCRETDVLVVGGGGAGFRAAISARNKGARALLISKGPIARCGASPMAGSDLTVHGRGMRAAGFFGEPNDTEEKFLSDVVHQGCFLNNQKLAEVFTVQGPARLQEMLAWGCKPTFSDERAIFTTGTGIMDALFRHARALGVEMLDNVAVLDLVTKDGQVVGAVGLELLTGEFVQFKAKAVVLATGGWHKAYTPVTGSRELTGDGVAIAYRAGARLVNMELVTFCCNVVFWPLVWRGSIFCYVISTIVGGDLEDGSRERVFREYDSQMVRTATTTEWNKCFVSHASAKAIRAGRGSPHGGVYFTIGDMPWQDFEGRALRLYPGWRFKGVDFSGMARKLESGEGVEVGPAAEYFEGGIDVDEHYRTSLPGLYAAGECALSPFGANRVMAAITEMLVSGAIAGTSAAERATTIKKSSWAPEAAESIQDRSSKPLERQGGTNPVELRKRLQTEAYAKLGPIRNGPELRAFLEFLRDLRENGLPEVYAVSKGRPYNKEWLEALDLDNMSQVLELSARAALERTESRGVHYREDFPDTDNDRWLKEITWTLKGGTAHLATRAAVVTALTPPAGVTPYLEMLRQMMAAHSDVGGHH